VYENGMAGASEDDLDDDLYQDYKMVFVVNSSLPMTPGKMAAQVGHAAIAVYQDLFTKQDIYGGPLLQWNENGYNAIIKLTIIKHE
jgi:peptidyl-tRNA hydrolase